MGYSVPIQQRFVRPSQKLTKLGMWVVPIGFIIPIEVLLSNVVWLTKDTIIA